MKRNLVLIHRILRYVEEHGKPGGYIPRPDFEGYDKAVVNYHVQLCREAGFLRFKISAPSPGIPHMDKIAALTWKGHDFLDTWERE